MTESTFMLIAPVLGAKTTAMLTVASKDGKLNEQSEFTGALQVCGEQAV